MTFFGRDNRPEFEAIFAEQERQRANEKAAAPSRLGVEDDRTMADPRRDGAGNTILRWVRRMLHR